MTTIPASWSRIDRWLARHAPASAAKLAPPADPDAIAAAERTLGLIFPRPLVASLLCHDGVRDEARVLPTDPLFSVADIVGQRQTTMHIAEQGGHLEDETDEVPDDDEDEPWWHSRWLPFAGADSESLVIDLRPGADEQVGRHWHDSGIDFLAGGPDLEDLLLQTADALEHGGRVWARSDELYPYLRDGLLVWDEQGAAGSLRPAPTGLT